MHFSPDLVGPPNSSLDLPELPQDDRGPGLIAEQLPLDRVQMLEQLRRLPARHYVAGHGRSASGWPEALAPEAQYLKTILTETRQALKAGKTIQEAVDTVGYSEQSNWVNFELYHRRNVTSAYTELEWE